MWTFMLILVGVVATVLAVEALIETYDCWIERRKNKDKEKRLK